MKVCHTMSKRMSLAEIYSNLKYSCVNNRFQNTEKKLKRTKRRDKLIHKYSWRFKNLFSV